MIRFSICISRATPVHPLKEDRLDDRDLEQFGPFNKFPKFGALKVEREGGGEEIRDASRDHRETFLISPVRANRAQTSTYYTGSKR